MDKTEFLMALSQGLADLPYSEQDKWLDFYSEMIDDRMEEGSSETEAVEEIGSVEEIVAQILSQYTQSEQSQKAKKKRELKPWHWVLLILGSPLWFALVIAAASVVFSLLVTAWSVVISFYAIAVSLIACGLAGILLMVLLCCKGEVGTGLLSLGAGLFCGGLGILWFIGTNYMTKGVVWLCKKLFAALLPGKENAV